jgi:hypothetical protein
MGLRFAVPARDQGVCRPRDGTRRPRIDAARHGTPAGRQNHVVHKKERACTACARAWAEYMRGYRARLRSGIGVNTKTESD